MNSQHKAIRSLLTTMAPNRALAYIKAFSLPQDEELCLIEIDVRQKSLIQVADFLHMTPDAIKKKRKKAFSHIADELNHTRPADN